MEALWLVVLVGAVVSGAVSGSIASSKGLSGVGYFLLGFFFPLIGILAAGFAVPRDQAEANRAHSSVGGTGSLAQAQRQKQLTGSVAALATLRPPRDPKTRAFLEYNDAAVGAALSACKAGDRILAFGRGEWDDWRVVFLLTDQRLVLSGVSPVGDIFNPVPLEGSEVVLVDDIDTFDLKNDGAVFAFAQGDLTLDRTSPFTSSEIEELIERRQQPVQHVEMAGPGEAVGERTGVRPAAASTGSGESANDVIGELERLDALHQSGAIDDAEFAELKRRLVWGDAGPTESSG